MSLKDDLLKATQDNADNKNSFGNKKFCIKVSEKDAYYKMRKGKNLIDVIPYKITTNKHPSKKLGQYDYCLVFWSHKMIGINNDDIVCLKKTYGKACPICEEWEAMKKQDFDKDEVAKFAPKQRVIYNVIDLLDEESKGSIKLFVQLY